MTADLKTPPIFVINSHNGLEELIIEFERGGLVCEFFWLGAAWVKSRAERPSVSGVNRQLHVQIGCKLVIRNRKRIDKASKAKQITN